MTLGAAGLDRRARCRERGVVRERRVVAEDARLELVQRRPRLQPQLINEVPSRGAIDIERLRLPPRAIQGEHRQLLEPFAGRVTLRLGDQLPDQVSLPAEPQFRGSPQLERAHPSLVERRRVSEQRGLARQPGKGRPRHSPSASRAAVDAAA